MQLCLYLPFVFRRDRNIARSRLHQGAALQHHAIPLLIQADGEDAHEFERRRERFVDTHIYSVTDLLRPVVLVVGCPLPMSHQW
jgi:hypothetical protein